MRKILSCFCTLEISEQVPSGVRCANGKPADQELASPLIADTASPTAAVDAVKMMSKAATPKLSAATDPFFLDLDVTTPVAKPISSGVQSLKER